MINRFYRLILVLILLVFSFKVKSQEINVNAVLDSNYIVIGDQIKLYFEVNQPKDVKLKFPQLFDTIVDKVEILERTEIDTTYLTADQILLKQNYLITSFDSGFYYFKPFEFILGEGDNKQLIKTEPLFLQVFTLQLDTADAIFDIKDLYEAPLTFRELAPKIGLIILIGLIIFFIIYYIIKRKKNEPVFVKRKPKEPAHIIAYRDLEKLKQEKLWQQNLVKKYYTRLTEVLRNYFENRYNIFALEQTSDETLESLINVGFNTEDELYKLMDTLFKTSDLVKFAKASPLPDENDNSLTIAYKFIEETKAEFKIEEEIVEDIVEENNKEIPEVKSIGIGGDEDK